MVMAQPRDECADVIRDHLLATDDFAAAHFERLSDNPFQRINIVKKNALELVDGGIGIARDGEVDDEERPPARARIIGASFSRVRTTCGAAVEQIKISTSANAFCQ